MIKVFHGRRKNGSLHFHLDQFKRIFFVDGVIIIEKIKKIRLTKYICILHV